MALTVTTRLTDDGNKSFKLRVVNLAFDATYPAGGEALAAADLGLASIIDVFPAVNGVACSAAELPSQTANVARDVTLGLPPHNRHSRGT